MKLDEAIDAVRAVMPKHRAIELADMNRPRPDYADRAIATILNAALDGSLIREAEARGMERAEVLCQIEIDRGDRNDRPTYAMVARVCRDAIRAEATALRGEKEPK